jgi:hypothetical protein
MKGSGFWVQGSEFKVQGSGLKVKGKRPQVFRRRRTASRRISQSNHERDFKNRIATIEKGGILSIAFKLAERFHPATFSDFRIPLSEFNTL